MSEFNCPYCKHKHDYHESELWEYGHGEHEFECWGCEREFKVYIEYEPSVTASCESDSHVWLEYWEAHPSSIDNDEKEVREKYPNLASSLWCKNCNTSKAKES